MKPILSVLAALALIACAPRASWSSESPDSSAAESPIQVEWSGTYASWYAFQGFDYSDRRPVFQPEVSATMKGISLGVWGNLDQPSGEMNEVDVTLRRDWEVGRFSGGLGYANLQYPNRPDWEPSQEILAEAELDGPVKASASVHWDVDRGHGTYWAFGLGHEIEKPAIGLGVKLYAQQNYYELTGISAVETRFSIRGTWAGVEWEPAVCKLWSWDNGDLREDDAAKPGWVISVSFSPP